MLILKVEEGSIVVLQDLEAKEREKEENNKNGEEE